MFIMKVSVELKVYLIYLKINLSTCYHWVYCIYCNLMNIYLKNFTFILEVSIKFKVYLHLSEGKFIHSLSNLMFFIQEEEYKLFLCYVIVA